jgi:hypothetical protein
MKILFLTFKQEDYLSDSLLHGLRSIYGNTVVDYPQKACMYSNYELPNDKIYGNAFSIYKTLENLEIDRNNIEEKIKNFYFSLIVFSDFSRQINFYIKFRKYINQRNAVILDGSDSSRLFIFHGRFWRKFPHQLLHLSYIKFLTFKREWTPKTLTTKSIFPFATLLGMLLYKNISLRKISFSIPEEKIYCGGENKEKLFPQHIVDNEVVNKLNYSSTHYVFENEKDYYYDLQISKFGVTTMRAGWDCMRHYEIAANGAVMCFRNLTSKEEMCAPHNLIPGFNCISYKTYDDLMQQINELNISEYKQLRYNSIEWAKSKTTKIVAIYFINEFLKFSSDISRKIL